MNQELMRSEHTQHPRVLFITPCAFNRETGGGITFGNLFSGWPKDKLATAHNDSVSVTTDICDRYFRLTNQEVVRWIPKAIHQISAVSEQSSSTVKAYASAQALRAAKLAKSAVFGNGVPEKGVLTKEFESWIHEFQPDLIYTILGTNGVLDLVSEVHQKFRVPLAIHMMDDWPSSIYGGGLFSGLRRRAMHIKLSSLMRKAKLRIAICDSMARTFEVRYGVSFVAYQNAVDLERWKGLVKSDVSTGDPFRMLYVGSILDFAQRRSLIDCCRAVASLNVEGRPVRFDIFSPDSGDGARQKEMKIHESIRMEGPITDDERFFHTLSEADLLVLPINFDRASVRHIKYSMPTKVPAYLASGTPILVYGPKSVAQTEYALQEGWGEVISNEGVEYVKNAIKVLADDEGRRRQLSEVARRVAQKYHDEKTVRVKFQHALLSGADRLRKASR